MERARLGDEIEISAPRGAFVLRPGEGPVVLLSAGIGATPVLAMLHELAAERSSREVWWLYGARNRTEHPFADEVRGLIGDLVHGRAHVSYSRPAADDVLGRDFQSAGHLDVDLFGSLGVPRESDFYLCGPAAFLEEIRIALAAWGVAPARINSELFGSEPSQTPGIVGGTQRTPHVPPGTPGTGPVVSFARSSLTVPWDPMYRSLLELAEACDVPTRWSCRTGVCHTCESGLLSGSVRYEPDPLDAPALGRVLICCSQPQDDVVLDI
jgi:ferredoxin